MNKSKYPIINVLKTLFELAHGFNPYPLMRAKKKICRDLEEKRFFNKSVHYLHRGGFLKRRADGKFRITRKGYKRINYEMILDLRLEKLKKDDLWRLIIFDIPENRRLARNLLRQKLKEFECYQLQKSVYVTPFVCEKTILKLVNLLELEEYVNLIIAKSLGASERQVKRIFGG